MKFQAFRQFVNKRRARREPLRVIPWQWLGVERLEDRLSHAVTAYVFNNVLQIEPAFGNNVIRLEIDPADHSQLEVLVQPTPVSPALFPLSTFNQIHVHAGTGNDTLIVDQTNGNTIPSKGLQSDGGDPRHSDTLQIVDNTANTWSITGHQCRSSEWEHHVHERDEPDWRRHIGHAHLRRRPYISGIINGGSAPLTIQDPAGNLMILDTVIDQGEPVSLSGLNVDIDGNIDTYGGNLTVTTPGNITVDPAPAPVIVSTRNIALGADPATAPSIGNSGNIAMTGTNITLGTATSSAALYSQVQAGSTFTPGSITLSVSQDGGQANGSDFTLPPILHLNTSTATITLNNAIVDGGAVTFTSEASNLQVDTAAPTSSTPTAVQTGIDFLKNILLIAGVSDATSTSTINLEHCQFHSRVEFHRDDSGDVGCRSRANLNQARGRHCYRQHDLDDQRRGQRQDNGRYVPPVQCDQHDEGHCQRQRKSRGRGTAIAVNVANSTSSAVVAPTAKLMVGGNLTDQATTANNKAVLAETTTGDDGNIGIAAAISYENDATNASWEEPRLLAETP